MPEVSIITVTYNNQETTKKFLDPIANREFEVIVFDNASSDETVSIINQYKGVKLIENKTNLGFAKACNQAAKASNGEFLLFLNPDVYANAEGIKKLAQYLESNEDIGLLAPKLILPNGKVQPTVRNLPSLMGAVNEFWLGVKGVYSEFAPLQEGPTEVPCVYGAAIMIRKKVFEEIKGFDEKYFLYYEDIDLCKKIKKQGLKIIYNPGIQFIHEVGHSSRQLDYNLPRGYSFISQFIPLRQSGSRYHLVKSANLYHGFLKAFLIRLVIYFGKG